MNARTVVTHLAVLPIGLGLGIGTVAIAEPEQDARTSASDTRILRGLTRIEQRLDLVNKNLSGYATIAPGPSLKDYLENIDRNIAGGR